MKKELSILLILSTGLLICGFREGINIKRNSQIRSDETHIYGDRMHVTPELVDRIADEQLVQGVDAILWLVSGGAFPNMRTDSLEHAALFYNKRAIRLSQKPKANLTVLRFCNAWASSI